MPTIPTLEAPPIDPVIRRQTVAGAKAIGALSAFLTTGQLAHLSEKSREMVREIVGEWHGVPHARHCLHPEKCAGRSSCSREFSCVD
jgi:hypothetical protein